jgi:hypothetical protein
MPRKPNQIKTVSLRVSINEAIYSYLERLVSSGLYGKNPAEAAEQLIARSIVQALDQINELPAISGSELLRATSIGRIDDA